MRILFRFVAIVLVAGIGLAGVGAALVPQAATIFMAHDSTSSIPELGTLAQRSIVFASDGTAVTQLNAEQNREPVTLAAVPPDVVKAVLAVEDQDFYVHKGINARSIIRAMFANVSAGGISQGGSTITQQVVKQSILTPEQTANRKLKEAAYALRLEKELTKDQILERYLNLIYLGNGAYGLQAGAEVYFGKNVGDLTIGEGAMLAALIRNPVFYDPFRFPERARERRSIAINRLVETGALDRAQADVINASPIPSTRLAPEEAPTQRGYFEEEVVQQILDDDANTFHLGETRVERRNALFTGGLAIHTTKDRRLDEIANRAVTEQLPDTGGQFTAATATIDPRTGAVLAIVGGPGFDKYQFNLATQGQRQPGSSFKTFVLVAALEAGARSDDIIDGNSPCLFPKELFGGPKDYEVSSASGGIRTIAQMTASSINCAFVRLGLIVGLDHVIDVAHRMGVTSQLEAVPSISLGAEEVSPLDMASAYGVLANNGLRLEPYYVDHIVDRDGKEIYRHTSSPSQVIDAGIAQTATKVLQGVVNGGTGNRARLQDRPAAGKTGTSQDNSDAWFVGFTPQLVTAVWMGSPAARVSMVGVGQFSAVQGGTYPALIWHQLMSEALDGAPVEEFTPPPPPARRGAVRLYLPGAECVGKYSLRTDPVQPGEDPYKFDPVKPSTAAGTLPSVPINGGYAVGRCGAAPPPVPDELTTTTAPPPTTVPGTPTPGGEATPTTPAAPTTVAPPPASSAGSTP